MMYEDIKKFHQQFAWMPHVENAAALTTHDTIIIAGMGGSHLAADILQTLKPGVALEIWSDYGLPVRTASQYKKTLVIASSFSGNTEETIDAFEAARRRGCCVAVVAAGGELIQRAKKYKLTYVAMPSVNLQPRMALGYSSRALLALMGEKKLLLELGQLAKKLHPAAEEKFGKKLAGELKKTVPIIYTSARNRAVAYNWKIKLNETGKVPAFYNVVPELNHNEMNGFDVQKTTRKLSHNFHFIFLTDDADDARVRTRMRILKKIYVARGLPVTEIKMNGSSSAHKIFLSLIRADWTAYYLARGNGIEPEPVPLVEEFKKLLRPGK